jgi:hypothetical protein
MVSTAANKNMPAAKYKIPIKLFWGNFLIFEVTVGIIYRPVMQSKMINLLQL